MDGAGMDGGGTDGAGTDGTATADRRTRTILAGAYGAAIKDGGLIGTEHLLISLSGWGGGVAERALAELWVTSVVVTAVRRQIDRWHSDDGVSGAGADDRPLDPSWSPNPRKELRLTGAARAALWAAADRAAADGRAAFGPVDLLWALMSADNAADRAIGPAANRAIEVLRRCGVEPADVVARLSDPPPALPPDDLPAELVSTREGLLGRGYRPPSTLGWIGVGALRLFGVNYAAYPMAWIGLEAQAHARRYGARRSGAPRLGARRLGARWFGARWLEARWLGRHRPGSAEMLLAMLATHEVADRFPHLVGAAAPRYHGARVLADLGVTHRAADERMRTDPPVRRPDRVPRRLDRYPDTTTALRALLAGDTAAARLLAALGVPPDRVRERLR